MCFEIFEDYSKKICLLGFSFGLNYEVLMQVWNMHWISYQKTWPKVKQIERIILEWKWEKRRRTRKEQPCIYWNSMSLDTGLLSVWYNYELNRVSVFIIFAGFKKAYRKENDNCRKDSGLQQKCNCSGCHNCNTGCSFNWIAKDTHSF